MQPLPDDDAPALAHVVKAGRHRFDGPLCCGIARRLRVFVRRVEQIVEDLPSARKPVAAPPTERARRSPSTEFESQSSLVLTHVHAPVAGAMTFDLPCFSSRLKRHPGLNLLIPCESIRSRRAASRGSSALSRRSRR